MRLSEIQNGQKVKLAQILAGHGLNHRLACMGLIPGTELTVINNRHPGPFVISVRNSRLILGRGIAHKITVTI
jgi:Fe2+ transport system protein FeoA